MNLLKPQRLSRQTIYQNRWVNLYVDRVQFPNGRIIDQHHLLDFDSHGVAAIVRNPAQEILFVQVCRYTTETTTWELPAGGIEPGEDPLRTAEREVLEETGYHTCQHELVYTYFPMDGIANKQFYLVRCQVELRSLVDGCGGESQREFDRDEIDSVRWFSLAQIREMIARRDLTDGASLTALLLVLNGWA